MARPKTVTNVEAITTFVPSQPLMTDAQQDAESQRQGEILTRFGDGLPFDAGRYEVIIRDHLSRSASEMLAAGRALIVVREVMPHGDWTPFIERIGIEYTVATRMMQAAFKFSDTKVEKLVHAAANKTKLFELMVLDDEDLQELADGGTVSGLELDDVERLSSKELRKALRDAREDMKARETLLDKKNTQIDNLEAEIAKSRSRLAAVTVDEERQNAVTDVMAVCTGLLATIDQQLHEAITHLVTLAPEAKTEITGHVTQVMQAMESIRNEFTLGEVVTPIPEWARED